METGVEGDGLAAARGGVGEAGAGELGASGGPQLDHVLAGVAGAAIELKRRDLPRDVCLKLETDFQLRAVVEARLGGCAGGAEEAEEAEARRSGRDGNVENLVGARAPRSVAVTRIASRHRLMSAYR